MGLDRSVDNTKQQNREALQKAIEDGTLTEELLIAYLEVDSDILKHRNKNGKTPLILALEKLADVDENGDDEKKAKWMVDLLLQHGADTSQTYNGWNPVQHFKLKIQTKQDASKQHKIDTLIAGLTDQALLDEAKSPAPRELTQGIILELRKGLGYTMSTGGLCRGYAHMAMQAFLVDPEQGTGFDTFEKRINWIRERGIENVIEDIERAKIKRMDAATRDTLTDDEKMAESVSAFYDGIELYQLTNKIDPGFLDPTKPMRLQAAEVAAPLAMSAQLEENDGLVTAHRGVGAFTHQGLIQYFEAISQHATTPISLNIGTVGHAICITYNPHTHIFKLIDANRSESASPVLTFNNNQPGYNYAEELARATERAFFIRTEMKPEDKLNLSTTMFARAQDKEAALTMATQWKTDLAEYHTFEKIKGSKKDDASNKPLIDLIRHTGDLSAHEQVNPKKPSNRRRIGFIVAGIACLVGAAAIIAISGGAAILPLAFAGGLIGASIVSGVGAYLSFKSNPETRVTNQSDVTHGAVGTVIKPQEAPLTEEAKKRHSSAIIKDTLKQNSPPPTTNPLPAPVVEPIQASPIAAAPPAKPASLKPEDPHPMEGRYRRPR